MFTGQEPLVCIICGDSFIGRKPGSGGDILCSACLKEDALPVISSPEDVEDIFVSTEDGLEHEAAEDILEGSTHLRIQSGSWRTLDFSEGGLDHDSTEEPDGDI